MNTGTSANTATRSSQPSPTAISRAELETRASARLELNRRRARERLADFCWFAGRGNWQPSAFHLYICEQIEAFLRGDIARLMLFVPAQHGKSEIVSRNFPAWALGKNPDLRIILCSYAADLAHSLSRDARRTMEEVGEELFDLRVSQESSAVSHWELADGHRGRLHASGVGGPVPGHGAEIVIIDDPHKGRQEARNRRLTRDLFETWYKHTLRPRAPAGRILLVSTRYDALDLPGWLLRAAEMEGEPWEVVKLPAMAEANDPLGRELGEPLWPERIGRDKLDGIKAATRGSAWSAVYQQNPHTEVEGAMWTQAMLDDLRRTVAPEMKRVVTAIDPAVTANPDSDETGILTVGLGVDDHAYVLSDRSGVFTPGTWAQRAVDTSSRHSADCIVGEVNNGGDLVEVNIRTIDRNVRIKKVRASHGKAIRAEPVASLYEQGRVHHVGIFEELEYQLTHMTEDGYEGEASPDRLDALVWAIAELLLQEPLEFMFARVG